MAQTARKLGILAGLMILSVTFVVIGSLALTLIVAGRGEQLSIVWFLWSAILGTSMAYGGAKAVSDPSLCALIQFLGGSFVLFFFVPNAAISLNPSACILFVASVALAFASGTLAHRAAQKDGNDNSGNPFVDRPRRWI